MSVSLVKRPKINYVHPARVKASAVPFVSAGTIDYVHPARARRAALIAAFGPFVTAAEFADAA